MSDISDQVRAEQELSASRQLLKQTFASLRDAVFVIDADAAEIMDCNDAACRMFGYSLSEMFGRTTVFLHVDEAALQEFREHLYAAVEQRGFLDGFEFRMKRRDGSAFPSEHTVTPLVDQEGQRIGWVSVVRDITERKQAEDQLRSSLQEKELLLTEIHHRVRNNLAVVCGLLDLQAQASQDERVAAALGESRQRVHSIVRVHEQLYRARDLARVDMEAYVSDLGSHLRRVYDRPMVAFGVDAAGVSLGIGQAVPCGLLVNELLSNAFCHAFQAGQRGEVSAALRSEDEDVVLTIRDSGTGLPEGLETEHPTSLGLQLVRTLVDQLSGTLRVERGEGTTFRVTFPLEKVP
jgi:PAS domain S-box-containing protein